VSGRENKLLSFLRKRAEAKGAPVRVAGAPVEDDNALARLLAQERQERAHLAVADNEELDNTLRTLGRSNKFLAQLQETVEERTEETRPAWREIERIVALPFHGGHTDADKEHFHEGLIRSHARANGFRFTEPQVEALLTFDRLGGLFGPIGVGFGKTFITLLCAALAYERGARKIALYVPPNVYEQLVTRDIPQARRDLVLFGMPFIFLGGEPSKRRRALTTSNRRGCYVMPYSQLSTRDASFLLDGIEPEVIIADEAHNLKNLGSARTKRMKHFIEGEGHHPQFVALSGTITMKSVMDYWHLLTWCLGTGSCLPLTHNLAYEWALVLDSETQSRQQDRQRTANTGPITHLCRWARQQPGCPAEVNETLRGFRAAYRFRMQHTPGVVGTPATEIGTSLVMQTDAAPLNETTKPLLDLMDLVTHKWLTPQQEPIEFALHKYKWLYELTAGFWHRLRWPSPEEYVKHRERVTVEQAASLIERAKEHHEAQKLYHGELGKWLRRQHVKGLDTPFLVANHIARHRRAPDKHALRVPGLVAALYEEVKDLDFEGRPERVREPQRVCDYKIKHAVSWADEHKVGIIWYHHNAIGDWLIEALREAGHDPLYCHAGAAGNKRILDSKGRLAVASIQAHSTGKNLQFHTRQHVVQWPRSAKDVEQMLGRLHRMGQEADELVVHMNHTLDFDFMVLASSLSDALYIHQTGGGRQKAVVAGWSPLPRTFPHTVLEERGLDPQGGDRMLREMAKHFGRDT